MWWGRVSFDGFFQFRETLHTILWTTIVECLKLDYARSFIFALGSRQGVTCQLTSLELRSAWYISRLQLDERTSIKLVGVSTNVGRDRAKTNERTSTRWTDVDKFSWCQFLIVHFPIPTHSSFHLCAWETSRKNLVHTRHSYLFTFALGRSQRETWYTLDTVIFSPLRSGDVKEKLGTHSTHLFTFALRDVKEKLGTHSTHLSFHLCVPETSKRNLVHTRHGYLFTFALGRRQIETWYTLDTVIFSPLRSGDVKEKLGTHSTHLSFHLCARRNCKKPSNETRPHYISLKFYDVYIYRLERKIYKAEQSMTSKII
jgi:hypothetical protein